MSACRPSISLPSELVALYRGVANRDSTMPPLSHAAARGLRAELLLRGVVCPPVDAPTRTTAATMASARARLTREA